MKESKSDTSRNLLMDIAKGIGICLIVLGHSFTEDSPSKIRSFVYLFHVPFFFIVSGYFFKESYIDKPKEFVLQKIKSLWVPFFFWSIPFILLHNYFLEINIYSSEVTFRGHQIPFYTEGLILSKISRLFLFKGSEQLLGAFWFLPSLFFTILIFWALSWCLKQISLSRMLPIVVLLLFCLGNIMIYLNVNFPIIPWDLRRCFIVILPYYLGYAYQKYEKNIPICFWPMALFLIILLIINEANLLKIDSITSVVGSFKMSTLYLIVTPAIGTYVIFYISKILSKYNKSEVVSVIGKQTIAILALHFLCFKFVSTIIVHVKSLPLFRIADFPVIPTGGIWFLVYSFVGIIVPTFFYSKFKKARDNALYILGCASRRAFYVYRTNRMKNGE